MPAPLSQGLIVITLSLCNLINSANASFSSVGKLGLALFRFLGSSILDLTALMNVCKAGGVA